MLTETNTPGWTYQNQVNSSLITLYLLLIHAQQEEPAGETLLESAEEFGRIVSSTLIKNASNVNSTQQPNIEKENIGLYISIAYNSVSNCARSIVLQTVQLAKEDITKVESAGYIPFLTNTNYSKFQGKNVSVNYPSNTIKERLQNSKFSYSRKLYFT